MSWSTLPCWQHASRTGLRIILVTLKQCAVQPPFGIQRLGSLMVDNPSDPETQGRKCMQPNSRRGLSLFQLMCFFFTFFYFSSGWISWSCTSYMVYVNQSRSEHKRPKSWIEIDQRWPMCDLKIQLMEELLHPMTWNLSYCWDLIYLISQLLLGFYPWRESQFHAVSWFLIVGHPPLPHKQNPRCLYQQKQTGMIFLSEADMKLNPQTPSFCSIIVFFPLTFPQPIFVVHIQTWPWNLKQLIHDSDSPKKTRFVFCFFSSGGISESAKGFGSGWRKHPTNAYFTGLAPWTLSSGRVWIFLWPINSLFGQCLEAKEWMKTTPKRDRNNMNKTIQKSLEIEFICLEIGGNTLVEHSE